jgi:hypothetical protein
LQWLCQYEKQLILLDFVIFGEGGNGVCVKNVRCRGARSGRLVLFSARLLIIDI